MEPDQKKLRSSSKFLSLVLRHQPELIGLELDAGGWSSLDELIRLANVAGHSFDRAVIAKIVAECDKQRFALSEDGLRIRANQGHSVDISHGLQPATPPDILYHGTATRFLVSITENGLHSAQRQHVHLSSELSVAKQVGARHGKPVVLIINARMMATDECLFYLSDNGVWLTDAVPVRYLREVLAE